MRRTTDNGATWSGSRLIEPRVQAALTGSMKDLATLEVLKKKHQPKAAKGKGKDNGKDKTQE